MRVWAVLTLAIGCLVGCASEPQPIGIPFYTEENQRCSGQGNGQITGQAFLRTVGGEVRYAAGSQVILWPDSAYSRKVGLMFASGITPQPEGKLRPYERVTQADGEGEFEFADLPPCNYVVMTGVFWSVSDRMQGGYLFKVINVQSGKITKVILTR